MSKIHTAPRGLNDPSALGPDGFNRVDAEIAAKINRDAEVERLIVDRLSKIGAAPKPVAVTPNRRGRDGYVPTRNGVLGTDIVTVLVENPKSKKSRERFGYYGAPGTETTVADLFGAVEIGLGRTEALKLSADFEFDADRGFIAIERVAPDGSRVPVDVRVSKVYRFEDRRGSRKAADVV